MQTDEIKEIQQYLRALSFTNSAIFPVVIDGKYGAQTASAVSAFQETVDLPVTGSVDFATWNQLITAYRQLIQPTTKLTVLEDHDSRIDQSSPKDTVAVLQGILWFLSNRFQNLPSVDINGLYDTKTQNSVLRFQELHQLPTLGFVDAQTWNTLSAVYNADRNIQRL